MKWRASSIALRVLGVLLVAWVLFLVGIRDRVVDASGVQHVGRIVSVEKGFVLFREKGEVRRLSVTANSRIHRGLAGAFLDLRKRPGWVLLGVVLHLCAFFFTVVRWHVLLRGAALKTPFLHVLRLSYVGQFFNVCLPGGVAGGDFVKAIYVAGAHPDRKTRAVVTIIADRLLGLFVLCLIAATAVVAAPVAPAMGKAREILLALVIAGAAAILLLASRRLRRFFFLDRLVARLPFQTVVAEVSEAVAVYRQRPGTVAGAALLALGGHACLLSAFTCYGTALGAALTPSAILVAIPAAQVLSAIPALPGGWGVGDFAFYFFLPATGVAAGRAVALSFTYRVLQTLLALPGALFLGRRKNVPAAAAN